jgi:hypothetical protein
MVLHQLTACRKQVDGTYSYKIIYDFKSCRYMNTIKKYFLSGMYPRCFQEEKVFNETI